MLFLRRLSILWIVVLMLAACAGTDEEMPTLAAVPEMSDTPIPTETLPPTETPTATLTPTIEPTVTTTSTSTATNTPTKTPFPTATPTHTLTFTPTQSPTATATFTPTLSPTPIEPVIVNFSANNTAVTAGNTIVLRWETQADSVRLQRLNQSGVALEDTSVPIVGSSNVVVPGGESTVIYRLIATRGGRDISNSLTVNVTPACTATWFFIPPDDFPCPAAGAVNVSGTYQTFQTGFMFRIQINGMDKVCGVQSNRLVYSCMNYLAYSGTPPVTPVPNSQEPHPDFQNMYYTGLAIGGFWYDVIGWGTALATSNPFTAQLDVDNNIYVQLPGAIYKFDRSLDRGTLTVITPGT